MKAQPPSNGPVMAEWTRGTSGVQSGVSIGFKADPAEAQDGAANTAAAQMNGGTAGEGQPTANGLAKSEATRPNGAIDANDANDARNGMNAPNAKDGLGKPAVPPANTNHNANDGPTSQYATLMVSGDDHPNEENKGEEGTVVARKAMSSANGPDSMSAVSKAGRESHQEVAPAVRDSINQVKPTESLSSAAAGVFPGSYAAAIATAASLVSQNENAERAAMMHQNKSLSSEMPINTNEALNALTNIPSPANYPPLGAAPAGTASQNQANARSPRFADWAGASVGAGATGGMGVGVGMSIGVGMVGAGASVGAGAIGATGAAAMGMSHGAPGPRPSRMGQIQAQHQMQNSSNSGNHQQRISIPPKKSFSSAKKHPMRPPPNAAAAIARMNAAVPTGSSSRPGGINIQLDQFAHPDADDAVSTVLPGAGEFLEVACDAVSKASGDNEAHSGGNKDELVGCTESHAAGPAAAEGRPPRRAPAATPEETGVVRRVTRSMARGAKRPKQ
jgi:hypothetical protein